MLLQITSKRDEKTGVLLNVSEKVSTRFGDLEFDKNGIAVADIKEEDMELLKNMGYTYQTEITVARIRGQGSTGADKIDMLYLESLVEHNARLIKERNEADSHAATASQWADKQKDALAEQEKTIASKQGEIDELKHQNSVLTHDLKVAQDEIQKLKAEQEKPAQPTSNSNSNTSNTSNTSAPRSGAAPVVTRPR